MDKKLTRYYWVVLLITLAIIAFFLASGTNELAAGTISRLLPGGEPAPEVNVTINRTTVSNRNAIPSGAIIVSRNIFDSTPPGEEEEVLADEMPLPTDGSLPLVQCTMGDVKLLAMVSSPRDPDWSMVSLEVGGQARLYRAGDAVQDRTVSQIGWRYLLLRGTRDECFIDMFDQNPARIRPSGPAVADADAPPPPGEPTPGIAVNGEFERTVNRSVVDQALANPTSFAKDVRVRPYKKDGEVVGFRLRRVQRGSAIEQLGAQRGDVLHSVNGIELKSVDDALTAYQKLRSDNQLVFSVTRAGKPVDLKINIE